MAAIFKVFGIGLNKTGTTTLGQCLRKLGYNHQSCNRRLFEQCRQGDFSALYRIVGKFDSFEDWPYPAYYKLLDITFPGSKFILTTRVSADKWFNSLKKHSLRTPPKHCRELAYGIEYPHQNKDKMIELYNKHNREVLEYFKTRELDFIHLCWEKGDGWAELSEFLKIKMPTIEFPHANKSRDVVRPYNIKRLQQLGIEVEETTDSKIID